MSNLDKLIILIIVIRAITKRAQIPFSAWLPLAIAAPTPVSALVHSSTLVTAGGFLLIRFHDLIPKKITFLCLLVGIITALLAGWSANFETDFKKVIALSTLRQLGLIFIILGLKKPDFAFFHLIIHALFKSTLFILAGFIIHNIINRQETRTRERFVYRSPLLGLMFMTTNISLCGFPFMTGFYSKDLILEYYIRRKIRIFLIILIILATVLTLSYTLQIMYFMAADKNKKMNSKSIENYKINILSRTLLLFRLRILGGSLFRWLLPIKFMIILTYKEKFYIVVSLISILFLVLAYIKNKNFIKINKKWASNIILYLTKLTKNILTYITLAVSLNTAKTIDKG